MRLFQPHIRFEGLWEKDGVFHIACPASPEDLTTLSGEALKVWFDREGRLAGSPVFLTAHIQQGCTEVPERTAVDLARLRGEPFTVQGLYVQLVLLLPKDFTNFHLQVQSPHAIVETTQELSQEDRDLLTTVFDSLDTGLNLEIRHGAPNLDLSTLPEQWDGKDLILVPSTRLRVKLGSEARRLWEADEDFWVQERERIFASETVDPVAFLPPAFTGGESRCIVDAAVFPPLNIRTYLTVSQQIALVMPLEEYYAQALAALRISESDLFTLAERGHVQFLLPHSLEKYPADFVRELVERAPSQLLLSRRLAAATIADARHRVPLLYPPVGSGERHSFLVSLVKIEREPGIGRVAAMLRGELSRIWSSAESLVHARGAMANSFLGVGALATALYREITGRDATVELIGAAKSIEWGAALNALVFPIKTDTYSEAAACEFCASLYSGVKPGPVPTSFGEVGSVVEDLLSIDSEAPVFEVVDAFSHADILRFRRIVHDLGTTAQEPEELRDAVEKFNAQVRTYEKRVARQVRLDVLKGLATLLAWKNPELSGISLAAWVVDFVMNRVEIRDALGGRILDVVRAVNALVPPSAVLVSRIRHRLNG